MPDDSVAVGGRLRWVRIDRGLTQVELAAASGIRQPIISKLETGARSVSAHYARQLGEALGADALALILGVERLDGD